MAEHVLSSPRTCCLQNLLPRRAANHSENEKTSKEQAMREFFRDFREAFLEFFDVVREFFGAFANFSKFLNLFKPVWRLLAHLGMGCPPGMASVRADGQSEYLTNEST